MTGLVSLPAATPAAYADTYPGFLFAVASTFAGRTAGARVLFTTDARDLWTRYLDGFAADRQTYVCNTCRQFVDRFGALATITEDGAPVPAAWDPATVPAAFAPMAAALADAVARARVTGVFRTTAAVLGTPQTGDWRHLAADVPATLRHTDRLHTPGQWAAEARENVGTVARALEEFSADALGEALRVLEADAVHRAERFIGPVRWLLALHATRATAQDARRRDALLWRAVATAPVGYCHPRASVVGPLLEDIVAGLPFETIRAKFNAKLHPLQYQRPQAALRAGSIAAAERLVDTLGIARSLERRFARLDECETLWTPQPRTEVPTPAAGRVFAHLTPKGAAAGVPAVSLPAQAMTWDKFRRTALPTAERMELAVPASGDFTALVTATHADAPPIVRWDREDRRNPVTAYVYHGGSSATQWGLTPRAWHPVTAVVPRPNLWGEAPQPQHGDGAVLVLAGAVDSRTGQGIALFPETLRAELHAVRAVIEAHSRTAEFSGREQASACGLGIGKGNATVTLRVHAAGRATDYRIDRWD